ncbi:hypothetical protein KAU15_02455 [candidate division WOR-3 bacterium]|nr:hypothetical protein [candidate division WOR-3 bacterium]
MDNEMLYNDFIMKINIFIIILPILLLTGCSELLPQNDTPAEYAYIIRTGNYENTGLIQEMCEDMKLVLKNHKVPYGVAIIANCKSGQILGIAEYSERGYFRGEYINSNLVCSSLFKIIPLSAAIGKGIYKPDSKIKYYGSMYSELKDYLSIRKKQKALYSTVAHGVAKSNNPVFAEIGMILGKKAIIEYAEKFLFNNSKISGMQLGYIDSIKGDRELIKLTSGLDYSYVTPFHALMIAMTIGNDGNLMVPFINSTDRKIQKKIVSKTTNDFMMKALSETTKKGTSKKMFVKFPKIAEKTYAKTGSLYGKNPGGFYNWFMGIYKGEKTNYAIITLVVNDPKWEIKSSYMGIKCIQFIRKYADN